MKASSNTEAAQKALSNKPNPNNLIGKNKVAVFPWILRSGYVNISEKGYLDKDANPSNYGFFQKLFTGSESIIATWEGSTRLVKPKDYNHYTYDFKIGKYYNGQPIDGMYSKTLEIEDVNINADFLGMRYESSITLRFNVEPTLANNEKSFYPLEEDMFKLYSIPELSINKWYYISNVETIFNDANTKIIACEVTFSSLGDKLQKSGRAIEQYVNYAAPGEPYAKPKIENKQVILDQENLFVNGISYIQIELQGCNAISGISIQGRELMFDINKHPYQYFQANKFLLPQSLTIPVNNPLIATSKPTQNFNFFPDEVVALTTNMDYCKQWKSVEDAVNTVDNAGIFTIGSQNDWLDATLGKNKTNWNGNGYYSFLDPNWKPLSGIDWEKTMNVDDNAYISDNLKFTKWNNMCEILAMNGIYNLSYPVLPLSMWASKPYYMSHIPIIGGLLTQFIGDARIGGPNAGKRPSNTVAYFMDCDVSGMLAALKLSNQGAGSTITGRVEAFLGAINGDNAPKLLGVNSLNTTLCFKLTDTFTTYKNNDAPYSGFNTAWIGQIYKPWDHKDDQRELVNYNGERTYFRGSLSNFVDVNKSFVIDQINITGLTMGNIKITCYDKNFKSQWTSTIKSNSNWTGSVRDWMTIINTGGWDETFCSRENDFNWPNDYNAANDTINIEGQLRIYNGQRVGHYYNVDTCCYIDQDYQDSWIYRGIINNRHNITCGNLIEKTIKYSDISNYNTKAEFMAHFKKICLLLDNHFNLGIRYWESVSRDPQIESRNKNFIQDKEKMFYSFDIADALNNNGRSETLLYGCIGPNNKLNNNILLTNSLYEGDWRLPSSGNLTATVRPLTAGLGGPQLPFEIVLFSYIELGENSLRIQLDLKLYLPVVSDDKKVDNHYSWGVYSRDGGILQYGANAYIEPEFIINNIKLFVV